MPRTPVTTGFFGKIPAAGDFVSWNLSRVFTDRWDRWMSRDLIEHPSRGPLDPRAWRFVVPAGIFGDAPAAGVWRMSEDRAGRRYPLVIARLGHPPDPGDAWFDAASALLEEVVEGCRPVVSLTGALSRLPPAPGGAGPAVIRFWVDDWEVHELGFEGIHDLAANGLPAMRAARPPEAEAP